MILFLVILFWALGVIGFTAYKIVLKGKEEYLIVFMCLYLPFYTTILSVVYQQTGSPIAVAFFQYAKEVMIFLTIMCLIFYRKDFFAFSFQIRKMDFFFIAFIGLAFIYMLLPLGQAGMFQKITYFKNILIIGLMYFFGRNMKMQDVTASRVVHIVLCIAVAAFVLNVMEVSIGTHFQKFTGYARYNEDINNTEPSGSYDLSWTFETQTGQQRFASFFSNPLELASAVLLAFPAGLIFFLSTRHSVDKLKYLMIMGCVLLSLWFSFSRASTLALFIQIFFIALIFRFYRIIFSGILLAGLAVLYFFFGASKDVQDFVYETITFQNASSFGHLLVWLEGVESMIASPQGIGLAMSGNAGGVDDSVRVGGENQFIIFGVQLGVLGLLLYIVLLSSAILYSYKAYNLATTAEERIVPFIAGSVKFGLLLPLFTANAELYLYVSFISWWMVGYSVSLFYKNSSQKTDTPHG